MFQSLATVPAAKMKAIAAVCLATFIAALAFSIAIPLLPILVGRVTGESSRTALQTGLLTGVYTFSLALLSPLFGSLADRHSAKPILLVGLAGSAIATGLFAFVDSLPALYASRALSGAFAAAIGPVGFVMASDWSVDDRSRGHLFALINGSSLLGALAGPALGGLLGGMWRDGMAVSGVPFVIFAALAAAVTLFSILALPSEAKARAPAKSSETANPRSDDLWQLLLFSALNSGTLGIFEIALSLRTGPQQTGVLLVECMVVMFAAQLLAFSAWFPPRSNRWLFAPAFGLLAIGLALLGLAGEGRTLFFGAAAIAAGAGILSPLIGYWISLLAGDVKGRELGVQTGIAAVGQTAGAALAGVLFGVSSGAAFFFGSSAALIGLWMAIPLQRRLGAGAVPKVASP